MIILISTQNHWNEPSGITSFIKDYSSKMKYNALILKRDNIVSSYYLNNKKVDDIKQIIAEIKPVIVHLHSPLDSSRYGGIINQLDEQNIPSIYFCHSSIREEIQEETQREKSNNPFFLQKLQAQEELFEKCSIIIFFNNHQKKIAVNDNKKWEKKSKVIYHGTEKIDQVKQKNKTEDNYKIILYCGRFAKEKGIIDLAKAYKKIATTETKLMLVGYAKESDITINIKKILKGTNYEIKEWISNQQELSIIYQHASVVVLPSHYDSFNRTGIEALAHNTPLIVSDIPSFQEIYLNKNCATPFKKKNINSLVKAIRRTISKPKIDIFPKEYDLKTMITVIEKINKKIKL